MRKPEADAWILEVLNHISARSPFETTHIELKRDVIPPKDFSRQFAGLANAARWHPVLVLFGVDRKGISGINIFEVGDWYAELRAQFEYGHAPTLLYQNFLQIGGKTVGAFVFDTSDPPYVTGVGKKGGPREVPWRYGSNTGPAGRYELLTLLLARAREPEVDVLGGHIFISGSNQMQCQIDTFVAPGAAPLPLVIPNHRIEVTAYDGRNNAVPLPLTVSVGPWNPNASAAKLTDSGVVVPVASRLVFAGFSHQNVLIDASSPSVRVLFAVRPIGFDAPFQFAANLAQRRHQQYRTYWEVPVSRSA